MSNIIELDPGAASADHNPPAQPINSLTTFENPSSVINAARDVIAFVRDVHVSSAADTERETEAFNNGLVHVLTMVDDALEYAEKLCERGRGATTGAA